ncbi:yagE family protein [Usnea florida]
MLSGPCCLHLRCPRIFTSTQSRTFSSRRIIQTSVRPKSSSFHSTGDLRPRNRIERKVKFSSSAPHFAQQDAKPDKLLAKTEESAQNNKRKSTRSQAAKNSLRRVAVEAQRSRDEKGLKTASATVTAICAAEEYDIAEVARIFEGLGNTLDPYRTELYPQVVHVALPVHADPSSPEETSIGDVFVFPSGTVVAWAVPESVLMPLVSKTLLPAAKYPLQKLEEEDLEYSEDPKREHSSIKGDRIILGTKSESSQSPENETEASLPADTDEVQIYSRKLDTVLTKIAFSSGLARSTKLAVLETLLRDYQDSTRSIPSQLSRGGRMPFTRRFISIKTGQLLSIRAQLNLYAELTDSLPDLFWDSRHELGLEGYYEKVGRALDTNIRIKTLNEKMDYAQEIASVLREHLSEAHGVRLEWIIILLITVEVFFALQREFKEWNEDRRLEDQKSQLAT